MCGTAAASVYNPHVSPNQRVQTLAINSTVQKYVQNSKTQIILLPHHHVHAKNKVQSHKSAVLPKCHQKILHRRLPEKMLSFFSCFLYDTVDIFFRKKLQHFWQPKNRNLNQNQYKRIDYRGVAHLQIQVSSICMIWKFPMKSKDLIHRIYW